MERDEFYASIKDTNDYIYHHGIKGQKWGVRRFQNPDGTLTFAGKERYRSNDARKDGFNPVAAVIAYDAVIALSPLVMAAARNADRKRAMKDVDSHPKDEATGLHLKTKETTVEQDMRQVNPGYPMSGTTLNCTSCSIAMDLRRRGYYCIASKEERGRTVEEVEKFYKNGKFDSYDLNTPELKNLSKNDRTAEVAKKLNKFASEQGNGAYGIFDVKWRGSYSGHSLFYMVQDGQFIIYDGQSGTKTNIKSLAPSIGEFYIMRTDNLEPDYDHLKKEGAVY